ncbi:ABC transporter permease [Candidatus Bathyarchaeota archaeon]|nr:ABC transporter permease [Candidatus Bathyarchaeota archaeon]NIV67657.1 ABC transporter permease [Candidatus Bathyarchaeota archaeon]NIW16565.1 ABC transporter permease [Candidatus Bathyarchaeota archaeon]NIW34705.1 ABC transporter permease [Candidatus Bathyarchaeota archaeon]
MMTETDHSRQVPKKVSCPGGLSWANLRAELRAIWESNVKVWKIELAYPLSFLRQSVQPLVMLLPFLLYGLVLVGGRYSEPLQGLLGTVNPVDVVTYIFTGYMIMGFIGTAVWGMGFSIRREQWFGTLESIYVTPTSRLSLVLGMALHSTMHQSISTGIEFLTIYVIFGLALKIQGILPALIIFALMMFALYGFGVLISALALFLKEGWIVAEGLYSVLMVLSPVAYPLAVLPNIVRRVSGAFPTGPALVGMRSFLLEGYPPQRMGGVFLHLLALDGAWILFGILVFYLVDAHVRSRGSLGKY